MSEQEKIDDLNQKIKAIIKNYVSRDGIFATPVKDLFFVHKKPQNQTDKCFEKPLLSVILQGQKSSIIGNQEYTFRKNSCIVTAIDIPSTSNFIREEDSEDFISLFVYFDREILSEIIMEMEKQHFEFRSPEYGVSVSTVDADVLECLHRLAELVEKPSQIAVRASMIMRELHYLVLIGSQGGVLYKLYGQESEKNNIIKIINYLKSNIAKPLEIEHLAKQVNMSVSSLYRHFKTVTGFSPLQYQKQLRLYEAQRLMIMDNERASSAALMVGYESVTQFNREYKRMFGEPPYRDAAKRKNFFALR